MTFEAFWRLIDGKGSGEHRWAGGVTNLTSLNLFYANHESLSLLIDSQLSSPDSSNSYTALLKTATPVITPEIMAVCKW